MSENKYLLDVKQSELFERLHSRRKFRDEVLKALAFWKLLTFWRRPKFTTCLRAMDAEAETQAQFWHSVRNRWPELMNKNLSATSIEILVNESN